MKVLFVSPEVTPLARTGGLGDVVGALPLALCNAGLDIRILCPLHRGALKGLESKRLEGSLRIKIGARRRSMRVVETRLPGTDVPVYLLEHKELYDRSGLYAGPRGDYPDNAERALVLCRSALELPTITNWHPDVYHAHDWMAAALPACQHLEEDFSDQLAFSGSEIALACHDRLRAPNDEATFTALQGDLEVVCAEAFPDARVVATDASDDALAVAAIYRRPIPVQPMKAVAALIIVGAVTPAEAMASGLIIGTVLLVLAVTGAITRIARLVPPSVIMGVQLGVGAQLALLGLSHVQQEPLFGGAALALLLLLFLTSYRHLGSLAVVVTAASALLMTGNAPALSAGGGLYLPDMAFPTMADFQAALTTTALPQLALTLSNAVLATSAIAAEFFPEDKDRISPKRLALSTGALNLLLSPLGALPMCHGSGGLIAQHRFGARGWGAPALFGAFCLILGLGFGPQARDILMLVPLGVLSLGAIFAGMLWYAPFFGDEDRDDRPPLH